MNRRTFSENRHREGAWDTTQVPGNSLLLRVLLNFASLKRQGVTRLARMLRAQDLVLDLGCGSGAYGQWIRSTKSVRLISVDWAFPALLSARERLDSGGTCVCADINRLPFKPSIFDAFYSIDTLGHVRDSDPALDECRRVLKNGGHFFLHSECSDYRNRLPDRELIRLLGYDAIALEDGHVGLRESAELKSALERRFAVEKSYCPAGILGWIIGYPEKYYRAFRKARRPVVYTLLGIFAAIKKAPLPGVGLRILNACTNRLELILGITGGGSFFSHGIKERQHGGELW